MATLTGKTAWVTGGGRGIGRSIALAFARAGADVAVSSRSLNELETVVSEIEALGCKALAVRKSVESVMPVTWALPEMSTAMSNPSSRSLPPR